MKNIGINLQMCKKADFQNYFNGSETKTFEVLWSWNLLLKCGPWTRSASPGTLLEIQMLGPTSDLLSQNHFTKIPK